LVAKDISDQCKQQASVYEASLESFTPHFQKLLDQFPRDFDKYRLDELVVAAIVPPVSPFPVSWHEHLFSMRISIGSTLNCTMAATPRARCLHPHLSVMATVPEVDAFRR
jgi:hypothetical protein